MVDGQPYTSLSSNGRRADVSWTGDANAKPSDILESVTSTHVQTNVTTNVVYVNIFDDKTKEAAIYE